MERGELKLVTDFAEVRVGPIYHVTCGRCGTRHRGMVKAIGIHTVSDGISRFTGMCFVLVPDPNCWPPGHGVISRRTVARGRVWREDDGLDQAAYDRELATLEAQAGRRSRARTLIDTALDAIDHPYRHPPR